MALTQSEQADIITTKYGIDMIKLQFKTMMMSMQFGLIAPVGYSLLAYYFFKDSRAQESAMQVDQFFWVLLAISVIEVVAAFYLRSYWTASPLILAETTFAKDFTEGIKRINILISAFVHSLVIYGLVLFLMGASIEALYLFAVFSVIAFQILRFRAPLLDRALVAQQEHVVAGRFRKSGGLFG